MLSSEALEAVLFRRNVDVRPEKLLLGQCKMCWRFHGLAMTGLAHIANVRLNSHGHRLQGESHKKLENLPCLGC